MPRKGPKIVGRYLCGAENRGGPIQQTITPRTKPKGERWAHGDITLCLRPSGDHCRRQGIVSGGLRERGDLKLGFQ